MRNYCLVGRECVINCREQKDATEMPQLNCICLGDERYNINFIAANICTVISNSLRGCVADARLFRGGL